MDKPVWSHARVGRELVNHDFFDGKLMWGQVLYLHRGPKGSKKQEKPYHASSASGQAVSFGTLKQAKVWVELEHAAMTGFMARRPHVKSSSRRGKK